MSASSRFFSAIRLLPQLVKISAQVRAQLQCLLIAADRLLVAVELSEDEAAIADRIDAMRVDPEHLVVRRERLRVALLARKSLARLCIASRWSGTTRYRSKLASASSWRLSRSSQPTIVEGVEAVGLDLQCGVVILHRLLVPPQRAECVAAVVAGIGVIWAQPQCLIAARQCLFGRLSSSRVTRGCSRPPDGRGATASAAS